MKNSNSTKTIQKQIKIANKLKLEGNLEKALLEYQEIIMFSPQNLSVWYQIAKIHESQKNLDKAINCYQKIIELAPDRDIYYTQLGRAFYLNNDFEKSILPYQKALEINPQQQEWVYRNLGNGLEKLTRFDEAIAVYAEALKLNPNSSKIYFELARSYLGDFWQSHTNVNAASKQQKIQEIFLVYKNQIDNLQGNLNLAIQEFTKVLHKNGRFNHHFYWQNPKIKLVYCNIPKNANTLFMNMLIDLSDSNAEYLESSMNAHQYMASKIEKFKLIDFFQLQNPEYFKFVILRNPLKRVVSGYLDKFVKNIRNVPNNKALIDVITDVHEFLGIKPDIERSITFTQFTEYLSRTKDLKLDPHWRPQYTFLGLGLFEFDFIGQFEKLDEAIATLEKKLDIKIRQNVTSPKHITTYGSIAENKQFHELYPEQLNQLPSFPRSEQLYTSKLEEIIRQRYAEDIQIYETHFNVKI
jgi:tetratricopeptide (TPR) repeat protein